MFLAVGIGAIALLGGIFLLLLGLRGRRVDDHPVCRKCGFDLTGRPGGASAGRCSECGTDLARSRAVRIGNRQQRRLLLRLGVLLTVICVMWLGSIGWIVGRGVDLNQYKPVWLLLRETSGKDLPARDAALAEIMSRVRRGKLPGESVNPVVGKGLAMQA